MSYTKSKIYQKGYQLAVTAEHACRRFPKHEQFALAQQLRNASRSVAANYVESYSRQIAAPSDCRRFLLYSLGSCDETAFWLRLAHDLRLIDDVTYTSLDSSCQEVSRMLRALLRDLRH